MATSTNLISQYLAKFRAGLGAWLVGTILAVLLEGLLLQQTSRYFRRCSADPWYLKVWVALTVVLQTLTIAFVVHTCYFYMIDNYNNPLIILKGDLWSAAIVPVFGALNIVVAESFFARRVFMVGPRYRVLVVFSMVLILVGSGFFLAVTAQAFQIHNVINSANTGGWLPTAGSALMLAGDVQLTGALIHTLHINRTGNKRTDSMLDTLIAYSISSGLLICISNTISLALAAAFIHNIIFTASLFVSQQVYSNSFLIALNTRECIRSLGELGKSDLNSDMLRGEKGSGTVVEAVALSSMAFATGPSQSQLTDMDTASISMSQEVNEPKTGIADIESTSKEYASSNVSVGQA